MTLLELKTNMEEYDRFEISTVQGKVFPSIQGDTVLNSALSSNIVFEYSCKRGQCGSCRTTLLKGEVKEVNPQLALNNAVESNQFLTCCCVATSDILIDATDLSALHGIEIKILPTRINSLDLMSDDIIKVKLRLPPTSNFIFLEGQHVDIIGPDLIKRSYSIASSSLSKEITMLIKRVEHGKLSDYWFSDAKLNDLLRIEGPKGTFFLRDNTKSLVFLATGTGVSPIISILEKIDIDPTFSQSEKISLFWGNRKQEDFIWNPDFNNIELDFHKIISRKVDCWNGEVGYVQDVALRTIKGIKNTDVYACGSSDMINSAKASFVEAGLNEKDFYSDAFVQSY